MKKLLLLLLCVPLILSCGEKNEKNEDTENNEEVQIIDKELQTYIPDDKVLINELTGTNQKYYGDELFTGVAYSFYENGNVHEEKSYVNGIPSGYSLSYYENSQLSFKGNYLNGEQDGIQKMFYDDGQLELEFNFSNGKQLYMKDFYQNGNKRLFIEFSNDQINSGSIWYENGQLMFELSLLDNYVQCWDSYGNEMDCTDEVWSYLENQLKK
jgi:antitoxin component YwqK of YwqJK toxin-antitoxin module